MHFDELMANYLGDFGPYQKKIYIFACMPAIFGAVIGFSWTFVGASIPHRCKLHALDNEWVSDVTNGSLYETATDKKIGQCFRFKNSSFDELEPCLDGYVWDNSEIPPSALQEWDLVCDRAWIKAMVQSFYFVGMLFGSLVIGYLADRFGRKVVLLACCALLTGISTAAVVSPNVWMFAVLRLAQGTVEPGVWQVPFVIGIELVGPSRRLLAGQVIEYFFSFGIVVIGLLAYFVRHWRTLQILSSVPGIIFLTYYWLMPESPRWLIAAGKRKQAQQILRTAAAYNKVNLPEEALENLKEKESEKQNDQEILQRKYTYFDLVRGPNMRRKTLITCYCWVIVTLVYYGISLNPSALAGDFYFSFILSALTEFVSITFLLITMNRLGRRAIQAGGFLISGLALMAILCIPAECNVAVMGLVLVSKLAVVAAYCTIYLYTSEMFPTVVRSIAIGLASTCARFGGIASPFASLFLDDSHQAVLLVLFGTSSVLAALLTLMLPETTFRRLPETLEDGERFGAELLICSAATSGSSTPEFEKRKSEPLVIVQAISQTSNFLD